jgi:putative hemolysin
MMEEDLFMAVEIIILVLLIILNSFFAASEMALISLNDNRIRAMADSGHKKAIKLQALLSEPTRFLSTIQIGITLVGFLASAFAAERFAGQLGQALFNWGLPLPLPVLSTLSVVVITLVLSYFTLVIGELVPKRIAMQKAEPIAMFAVGPLTVLSKITLPFVKLLTASTNVLLRAFGIDPNANKEEVTEEEIRMMVDVGNENGSIQESERMMINNIFEFNNKVVSDIMTHRTHVVAIPHFIPLPQLVELASAEKYSRFPVYENDFDNIIGVLHTKDLLPYLNPVTQEDFKLDKLLRLPYFVPAAKRIDELYRDMQKNKVHIAIAIDEYGGTTGIVTIEDLLEEIVGNIFDEHDEEEREYEKLDDNTFVFDALSNIRDVNRWLGSKLPEDDHDTLSGFIIGELGRIPKTDERPVIEFEDLVIKVEEVVENRIGQVKVYITPDKSDVVQEAD